jgi:hypothetical protein
MVTIDKSNVVPVEEVGEEGEDGIVVAYELLIVKDSSSWWH